MSTPLLETIGLKKYFKTQGGLLHAVDDINLSINVGETLGVVGESGCGKSTLGRTILRLHEATEGEILFKGKNILNYNQKELKKIRTQMQMIFQDPFMSLNPRLSINSIIADPMKVTGVATNKKEMDNKVSELMELCGLPNRYLNTYPHELDGGRRQRVGLARALATNPEFIVCDEPVSALDVSVQAQILNLLMDLQDKKGLSYIFITHDLCVVRHISDNIMVMYMGKVVEYASKYELFKNPSHPYTKALLTAIPTTRLDKRKEKGQLLTGEVANPINPAPGCRFAPRCQFSTKKCFEDDAVKLKEIAPAHYVACTLY